MPTSTKTQSSSSWLVVEGGPGLTIAPSGTPLTRLHYFDGKFLRASDLELEQSAQRQLVHLSNQAGGFGIVRGFTTRLISGGKLEIGPGQAIDAAGRVLLLPNEVELGIAELIERSQRVIATKARPDATKAEGGFKDCELVAAEQPDKTASGATLWLITIAHAEFLCGEEDVFGKLCEQACVGSTERPYRVEGVLVRARPLALTTALPSSSAVTLGAAHLRSRVASAYFADQERSPASLINADGLRGQVWCAGAEQAEGEIALGVLAWPSAKPWFDPWTARRERIESPPKIYWAQRMAMRPWREFLAQVLQFQCQLVDALVVGKPPSSEPRDPCAKLEAELVEARKQIKQLLGKWSEAAKARAIELGAIEAVMPDEFAELERVHQTLEYIEADASEAKLGQRVLIQAGIVELPPAGYLPIDPQSNVELEAQVARLLGEGVDLRFCCVREDDIPRELEHAQHMDRISLVRGLGQASKPTIDILVPEGEIMLGSASSLLGASAAALELTWSDAGQGPCDVESPLRFSGVARRQTGGLETRLVFVGATTADQHCQSDHTLWLELVLGRRVDQLGAGGTVPLKVELICCERQGTRKLEAKFDGDTEESGVRGSVELVQRGFGLADADHSQAGEYGFALTSEVNDLHLWVGRGKDKFEQQLVLERGSKLSGTWLTKVPGQPQTKVALVLDSRALVQADQDRAIEALTLLALLRCEPELLERGLAKLFPLGEAPPAIKPKLPWVLFRARPRHECPTPAARPDYAQYLRPLAGAIHHLLACRETCSIIVTPRDDLHALLEKLRGRDVSLCLAPGLYELEHSVSWVGERKHLKLIGAGPATRIRVATRSEQVAVARETALELRNWASVTIRDLALEGGVSINPRNGLPRHESHLRGALHVHDCDDVVIERVRASCVGGPNRERACISVVGQQREPQVLVRGCKLRVGTRQLGLLIIRSAHATIRDNHIEASGEAFRKLWLVDKRARARVREALAGISKVAAAAPRASELRALTKKIVRGDGISTELEMREPVDRFREQLLAAPGVGEQGIVVGGAQLGPVWILDNRVERFEQGIHVGASVSDPRREDRRLVQQIVIAGNLVRVEDGPDSIRALHGIFVGNHQGCEIRNNRVFVPGTARQRGAAIVAFGQFRGSTLVVYNQLAAGEIRVTELPGSIGDRVLEPNLYD